MVVIEINDFTFAVSNPLAEYWRKNSLEFLNKKNMDRVYIVDGSEGLGKSTWTFQQMAYLEPEVFDSPEKFVSRIAFTPDQFMDLVRSTKNGVIVFDEAFRGFSSRAALSKINRRLVQALMEMRQHNNIVFIVLPSIFLLDIYPAMLRSTGLFNIYANKRNGRRVWQGFNKRDKNAIYQVGIKKGWTYFKQSKFRDYFSKKFPIGPDYEEAYLKKKEQVFREEEEKKPEATFNKYEKNLEVRDAALVLLKEKLKLSDRKLAKVISDRMQRPFDHTILSSSRQRFNERAMNAR